MGGVKNPQQLASRVFITASILFGITGIIMILTASDGEPKGLIGKILGILVFIILSSFGVSVGFKYLSK